MKSKILLMTAVFLTIFSCKNKEEEQPKEEKSNAFTITVNMIVKKNDNFQIYYMEDVNEPVNPANYVDVAVTGSDSPQAVVFNLPKDVLPANIRFDLGSNKEQESIKIIDFNMTYFDKKFDAKGEAFDFFFGYNPQVSFDKATSTLMLKVLDNEPYDPICIAKTSLHDEFKKMMN